MKSATQFLFGIGLVILLAVASSAPRGQSGAMPGVRGRTDPVQREMDRKLEMAIIENALRESPARPVERYQPLVLEQIREDFLQIQVVDRKLTHSRSTNDLPDSWERRHGLNPHDPADGARLKQDGYTNLEEYLNSIKASK